MKKLFAIVLSLALAMSNVVVLAEQTYTPNIKVTLPKPMSQKISLYRVDPYQAVYDVIDAGIENKDAEIFLKDGSGNNLIQSNDWEEINAGISAVLQHYIDLVGVNSNISASVDVVYSIQAPFCIKSIKPTYLDNNYTQGFDSDEIGAIISTGLKNQQATIDLGRAVPYSQKDTAALNALCFKTISDHPEYFYAVSSTELTLNGIDTSSGSGANSVFSYSICLDTFIPTYLDGITDEDKEYFNDKVDAILAGIIKTGMTDAEKALAIHDYIAEQTVYGYKVFESEAIAGGDSQKEITSSAKTDYMINIENNESALNGGKLGVFGRKNMRSHTAYGVLIQGVSVCQGYSLAFKLFMDKLGIENQIVASDSMEHQWNTVKIDGKWYHVDVTHDDPTFPPQNGGLGQEQFLVQHKNFLVSDETLLVGHNPDWNPHITCTDKAYEGLFNEYGAMYYKNGYFYYKDDYSNPNNVAYYKVKLLEARTSSNEAEYNEAVAANRIRLSDDDMFPQLPQGEKFTSKFVVPEGGDVNELTFETLKDLAIKFENTSVDEISLDLWVAYYNDTEFVSCGAVKGTVIEAGKEATVNIPNATSDSADNAKIFVWDANNELVPLTSVFAISDAE